MTRSWRRGLPAFAVVAGLVILAAVAMDRLGLVLASPLRVLLCFAGVSLAVAAGAAMARSRSQD